MKDHRQASRARSPIAILSCCIGILLTARPADAVLRLSDATQLSGIWRYAYSPNGPWIHPPGAAFVDFDNDGYPDLYLLQGAPAKDLLAVNQGFGRFSDATTPSGLGTRAFSLATVTADYDNNGWMDLFIGVSGENLLYRNDGGLFTDITATAGVGGELEAESFSPAWLDCDNDGWIDLYVGNWGARVPGDLLYRNNGDGTFTDITTEAGIDNDGYALAIGVLDYDNDGLPDLYVANDTFDDVLYHNLGDCTFEDVTAAAGVGKDAGQAMGVAIGDYDNDGWLDIYVTDTDQNEYDEFDGNPLYRNNGDGTFTNVAIEAGAAGIFSWGAVFVDLDLDGWLDLYVATHSPGWTIDDLVLLNQGGVFVDAGLADGNEGNARGVAIADLERDGDPDLFVVNTIRELPSGEILPQPSRLWRNDSTPRSWLAMDLIGTESNRTAIGARVETLDGLGRRQMREVPGAMSFNTASSSTVHFGLGDATDTRVRVQWPSGAVTQFGPIPTDQYLRVVENGPGLAFARPAPTVGASLPTTAAVDLHPLGADGRGTLTMELWRDGELWSRSEPRPVDWLRGRTTRAELVTPGAAPLPSGRYRWVVDLHEGDHLLARAEQPLGSR